jgi:RNA polymerase sigma-70 factor (ECF subfamily)
MQVVDREAFPVGKQAQALSDVEVVRRVRDGETALFEILMRRYNQRLYRVARSILKDDGEAEDVMQQAYVNAYTHLDQFAGRALFSTWLTKIAVYEAQARSKRRGAIDRRTVGESGGDTMTQLQTPTPDPEHQAFATELRLLIESAVDGLPEHHRLVFALRDVEGLSTTETAECLGISEENVKTRLHRARALLRTDLLVRTGAVTSRAFRFHLSRCDRVVSGVLERITRPAESAGTRAR